MKIKINPLTVLMFLIITIMGNLYIYILTYLVMTLHESAHLFAAKLIGLKPKIITFSPFGVHLTLDNKLINSIYDEIILYSAGPLVNSILALISMLNGWCDLYRLNTALLVMNILPILPLDGGMILLRLISYRFGRKRSKCILNSISIAIGCILLSVSVYMTYIGQLNISMFLISVLLIGNILTGKEMCDTDLINALNSQKKYTNKANMVIIDDNHTISDAIKGLSPSYTTVALKIDNTGNISEILTEKSLLNNLDF